MTNPNIRAEPKRKLVNVEQKSILVDRDYFDCANPQGATDNSGCTTNNSLCKCPCTGGTTGAASAVPLFREPKDAEMAWAKKQISFCPSGNDIKGYMAIDPDALLSNCNVQCHEKNFHSFFKVLRTYSTFWDTPKKVPLYRNALINLYEAERASCTIPGNLNIKVGDFFIIEPDGTAVGNIYSGAWLISEIKHDIRSFQNYRMVLYLIRDSKIDIIEEEG